MMALRGFVNFKRILDHAQKQVTSAWSTSSILNSNANLQIGLSRPIFTKQALGTDGYEKQRIKTQTQFAGMVDKFREKMREFTQSDSKQMIFTEDLKNMVHLVEDRPEDLSLIVQMIKRFNKQNRHLRFGNFVFGPVVMRMFHFLNQPKLALEAFTDPELEQFFEQLGSFQILFDLLYKNEQYQSILDTFPIIQKRQVGGQRFPRNVTILMFAACYKLNTVQSYETLLQLLKDMKEHGVDPVRRCISFAAALALNQNAPQIALEILSNSRNSNYVTIRNLKLWALADMNRADDCLPILRYSIEFDSPNEVKRQSVISEILEKVAQSVERLENTEVTQEFGRIKKALADGGQISQQTMAELLEVEIDNLVPKEGQGRGGFQQMGIDRSYRGQRMDFKPQRNAFSEANAYRQRLKSDVY